jgi:hypothetical protein
MGGGTKAAGVGATAPTDPPTQQPSPSVPATGGASSGGGGAAERHTPETGASVGGAF